jgi:hypothetical protein
LLRSGFFRLPFASLSSTITFALSIALWVFCYLPLGNLTGPYSFAFPRPQLNNSFAPRVPMKRSSCRFGDPRGIPYARPMFFRLIERAFALLGVPRQIKAVKLKGKSIDGFSLAGKSTSKTK